MLNPTTEPRILWQKPCPSTWVFLAVREEVAMTIRQSAMVSVLAVVTGTSTGSGTTLTENYLLKTGPSGSGIDSTIYESGGVVFLRDILVVQSTYAQGGEVQIRNLNKNGAADAKFWSMYNLGPCSGCTSGLSFLEYPNNGGGAPTFRMVLQDNGDTYLSPSGGNVGIGKMNPTKALDVAGDIKADGTIFAKYQDVAEWVDAREEMPPGTVVVITDGRPGLIEASRRSYDTAVAGVVAKQPGIVLGDKKPGMALVAHTGRVPVMVDASNGPIKAGDLLVTSDTPGMAMKSAAIRLDGIEIHRPGTVLGKALEPISRGRGQILVLLTLQ